MFEYTYTEPTMPLSGCSAPYLSDMRVQKENSQDQLRLKLVLLSSHYLSDSYQYISSHNDFVRKMSLSTEISPRGRVECSRRSRMDTCLLRDVSETIHRDFMDCLKAVCASGYHADAPMHTRSLGKRNNVNISCNIFPWSPS